MTTLGKSRVRPRTAKGQALRVDSGTAYELVVGILAALQIERGGFESGPQWHQVALEKAPALLDDDLISPTMWDKLIGLIHDHGPGVTARELADLVAATEPIDLRRRLLGAYERSMRSYVEADVLEAAARGDGKAIALVCREGFAGDPMSKTAFESFKRDPPEQTRERMVTLLRGWYGVVFQPIEARLTTAAQAAGAHWLTLAETSSAGTVVEYATGGIVYVPDVGSRASVLVPSTLVRPVVLFIDHRDVTIFICPIGPEAGTGSASPPPDRLVRLTKALADQTRLQVLALVREHPRTAKEIAAALGIPRTSIFYHMIILRTAGLVRQLWTGFGPGTYVIRDESLPELTELLSIYLTRPPTDAVPEDAARNRSPSTKQ